MRSSILHETGTNKELAAKYEVSERTIYRWKAKARAMETGAKVKKPRRPRLSTLQNFKGTRKQLAKKYGVSERTIYRWLQNAKQQGADITSRQPRPKYPGAQILMEYGTNKELADIYGVSTSTISRWKRRARAETEIEQTPITPAEPSQSEFIEDSFEEDFRDDFAQDYTDYEPDFEYNPLKYISDALIDESEPILPRDSLFYNLDPNEREMYIDAYLRFQYGRNERQFYDEQSHSMAYDPHDPDITNPSFISTMDIWGPDFEEWLEWQEQALNIEL